MIFCLQSAEVRCLSDWRPASRADVLKRLEWLWGQRSCKHSWLRNAVLSSAPAFFSQLFFFNLWRFLSFSAHLSTFAQTLVSLLSAASPPRPAAPLAFLSVSSSCLLRLECSLDFQILHIFTLLSINLSLLPSVSSVTALAFHLLLYLRCMAPGRTAQHLLTGSTTTSACWLKYAGILLFVMRKNLLLQKLNMLDIFGHGLRKTTWMFSWDICWNKLVSDYVSYLVTFSYHSTDR